MTTRSFEPGYWATVLTGFAVIVLLALGSWQVQRLVWKQDVIRHVETRLAEPALPLPEVIEDIDAWDFRRASVSGNYRYDLEFLLGPRTKDGKNGWHVITPLTRISGGTVLVNRGWVPDEATQEIAQPVGLARIEGVTRDMRGARTTFTPDNAPEKGEWYWLDIPAAAYHLGLENLAPVVLYADDVAGEDAAWPVGGQARREIRNAHLQYAGFWYFMAFALFVIYTVRHITTDDKTA